MAANMLQIAKKFVYKVVPSSSRSKGSKPPRIYLNSGACLSDYFGHFLQKQKWTCQLHIYKSAQFGQFSVCHDRNISHQILQDSTKIIISCLSNFSNPILREFLKSGFLNKFFTEKTNFPPNILIVQASEAAVPSLSATQVHLPYL